MELKVNGDARSFPDGITVAQLLENLKVIPERVVVEVNLTILKRNQHPATTLKEGDEVEIVQAVGGGSTHLILDQPRPARKAQSRGGRSTPARQESPKPGWAIDPGPSSRPKAGAGEGRTLNV